MITIGTAALIYVLCKLHDGQTYSLPVGAMWMIAVVADTLTGLFIALAIGK